MRPEHMAEENALLLAVRVAAGTHGNGKQGLADPLDLAAFIHKAYHRLLDLAALADDVAGNPLAVPGW